jgi:hypothetical protein
MSNPIPQYKISHVWGDNFNLKLLIKDSVGNPYDFSPFTAKMDVRRSYFNDTPVFQMNSLGASAGITFGSIGVSNGLGPWNVQVSFDSAESKTLPQKGSFFYDIVLVDSLGVETTRIGGVFEIFPRATRQG